MKSKTVWIFFRDGATIDFSSTDPDDLVKVFKAITEAEVGDRLNINAEGKPVAQIRIHTEITMVLIK